MTHEPRDFPPEFLAAYVDDELGTRDRARVERWLRDHPEARELLETQESLSPANGELWCALTPPQPSSRQWADTCDTIARRLEPSQPRRRWATLGLAATLFATAAAVLILIFTTERTEPPVASPIALKVVAVDETPYPMAGDHEVRIVSLPESAATLLVVGEHPLADSALLFATIDEVEFFGVGSDLAGRFPERPGDPAFEEAPLLWAPREP
jgi:anti-sigma factor RsiW